MISSSDNKKILLTSRNVRLDSGRYATKYYYKKCQTNTFTLVMNIITIPIEKVIAIIKQIRKKSDALDAVPRSEVPVQIF